MCLFFVLLAEGLVSQPVRPKPCAKREPEGTPGTRVWATSCSRQLVPRPCAGPLPATLCHDLVSAGNWTNELRCDTLGVPQRNGSAHSPQRKYRRATVAQVLKTKLLNHHSITQSTALKDHIFSTLRNLSTTNNKKPNNPSRNAATDHGATRNVTTDHCTTRNAHNRPTTTDHLRNAQGEAGQPPTTSLDT